MKENVLKSETLRFGKRTAEFGVVLVLSFPPVSYTDQKPRVKKTIAVGLI